MKLSLSTRPSFYWFALMAATSLVACGGSDAAPAQKTSGAVAPAENPKATAQPAATPEAKSTALELPTGNGPDALFDNAATLSVGPDRKPILNRETATAAIPKVADAVTYKPVVSRPLVERLTAWVAASGHRRLNVRLDRNLGADVLWTVLRSASLAEVTEIRVAMSKGALALHSPKAAQPDAKLPRAGHLALMIGEQGVNGRVFAGPSSDAVFPVFASGGGRPISGGEGRCPTGPRPQSGRIAPALTRAMGEPLCATNGSKPYWIVVASTVETTVEELTTLAAAAASPAAGCKPRVALATPAATVRGLAVCAGAIAHSEVADYVAKAATDAASGFDAVRRAAGQPFPTGLDTDSRNTRTSPTLAAKLKGGDDTAETPNTAPPRQDQARVSLGRVATSDNDASRDAISVAMRAPLAQISECYKAHLKTAGENGFSGLMGMGFQVEADGSIGKPGFAKRSPAPDDLKLCIAKVAPSWKFPPPAGAKPVQAMVPIVLRKPATGPKSE